MDFYYFCMRMGTRMFLLNTNFSNDTNFPRCAGRDFEHEIFLEHEFLE